MVATRRTKEFLHYSLAGQPTVEETEVLSETVERVVCRWCGSADAIERIPRVAAE